MFRIARLSRTGPLLCVLALAAQSVRAQDQTKEVTGVWEGPYQSDAVPPGNLKLTVARTPAKEWQVTLEVFADQPPTTGSVRDFKVEGNKVSWVQDIADMVCASAGTMTAGVLKGTAECSQGGAVVVTATFLLAKAKS